MGSIIKINFGDSELLLQVKHTTPVSAVKILISQFKASDEYNPDEFYKDQLLTYMRNKKLVVDLINVEEINFYSTPVKKTVSTNSLIKEKISFAEFKRNATPVMYGRGADKRYIIYYNENGFGHPYKYKIKPFSGNSIDAGWFARIGKKEENLKRAYELLFEKEISKDYNPEIGDHEVKIGEFKISLSYS